jgi:hypothetical protein
MSLDTANHYYIINGHLIEFDLNDLNIDDLLQLFLTTDGLNVVLPAREHSVG